MTPIETEYRGVTFRSRLEARWAVFFDAMEIGWVYEPSEFRVEGCYQPDFLLNDDVGHLVEVKPVWPTKLELDKCRMAAATHDRPVLLLIGLPDFKYYWSLTGRDEFPVFVKVSDGVLQPYGDQEVNPDLFEPRYHAAIEKVRSARFDGYDEDRIVIQKRYEPQPARRKPHDKNGGIEQAA